MPQTKPANNALVPLTEKIPTDLAHLSNEDLLAALARGMTRTAEELLQMGLVWAELERRGVDLSDFRQGGLVKWLPQIATGQLAAEAVLAFAGRPSILHAIEGVPLERQRALARGEEVQVLAPDEPGGVVSIPLKRCSQTAIRLIFAEGQVRSPAEQRLSLQPRQRRQREDADRHFRPRYDRAAGVLRIGKMTVRLSDLMAELSAAAGPELPALLHKEEYQQLRVRLSPEEAAKLLESARQMELPEWEVVRKALRAFGLI